MRSHNEVAEQIELQEVMFNKDEISEAWQIEEVSDRAHEIHRAHGGLFGYDLEDWLQAERELVERTQNHLRVEETAHAERFVRNQERNSQKCLGMSN